jgi:uncharacterized membrane protein
MLLSGQNISLTELTTLQLFGWVAFLASLFFLMKQLPVRAMLATPHMQHMVFGGAACLFFLWLFQVGIVEGLKVHFLWLTAASLTLGFRRALIASSLALLGITLVGIESWQMLGINGVIGVLLPLSVSYLVFNLAFHNLPRHFFVYIFVCAFLTGAMAITLKMATLSGYVYLEGFHDWQSIKDNYLILIVLMLFPEAMLNGMTMTLLVIYKPQWVYSFYDKHYLLEK